MKVIGFIGRAGSGKNEAAKQLESLLHERGLRCKQLAFAALLKRICEEVWGVAYAVPQTAFYGTYEEKARVIPELGMSGREILQKTGEFFRSLAPEVWCKYLIHTAERDADSVDVLIITDVRFLNEAQAVHDSGGTLVRICRHAVDTLPVTCGIPGHASENEHDGIREDIRIYNDFSLEFLRDSLLKVIDF